MNLNDRIFSASTPLMGGLVAISLFVNLAPRVSAADLEPATAILGRWDLTVNGPAGPYPSWLEVRKSGYATLVGSFVGRFGSSRPISKIDSDAQGFRFVIPPQWEQRSSDLVFSFSLDGDKLTGQTTDEKGRQLTWTGARAPSLIREQVPTWGDSLELFNGRDLDGWQVQLPDVPNGWVVRDGLLFNEKPGNNLVSTRTFDDFQLHAEFRYPAGSNSGIYLRGRYEVQIEDNFGGEAECHKIGGVYGFLTPAVNAAKRAGEWHTYDITLVGRTVTVVLNGERVIDRQAIPGPTGGALDSHEADPGPILLQGDHGQVEFRKLVITPRDTSFSAQPRETAEILAGR